MTSNITRLFHKYPNGKKEYLNLYERIKVLGIFGTYPMKMLLKNLKKHKLQLTLFVDTEKVTNEM